MAMVLTKLTPNADRVEGNRRIKVRTVTWDANYQTDAHDTFSATAVGLNKIDYVRHCGLAAASAETTAVGVVFKVATDKESVESIVFETGSATTAAFAEKNDNEAFPTGASIVIECVGY
jgi:hypothetical protein